MMAQSAVLQTIEDFRAAVLAQEGAQFAEMARRWLAVESALEARISALAFLAAEQGGTLTAGQLQREARYVELLRQVRDEVQRYADTASAEVQQRQLELAQAAIDTSRDVLGQMGTRLGATFNTVNTSAVRDMIGSLADGSPLSTLLRASWLDGAAALTATLINNTALGVNPRKTASEMINATGASLDRMLRIARTEQLRVVREATRDSYQKSGVVQAYRRLARKDLRTCAACLIADGTLYPTSQAFEEHVNGRCSLVPVLVGVEEITWLRGKQWLEQQPPDIQRQILGPGRYDGWQAGLFNLDDIPEVVTHETWGNSLQIRSLRDLLEPPGSVKRTA